MADEISTGAGAFWFVFLVVSIAVVVWAAWSLLHEQPPRRRRRRRNSRR